MNETLSDLPGYNRRDFIRGGSVATLMTMLGGVELFAQTNGVPAAASKPAGPKVKVAVIGLGAWGREIVNTLARQPQAEVAVICDNYPAFLKRSTSLAPNAAQTGDYKTILEDKAIKCVVVATGTHQHKEIALAALKAGKHVYCEAPLAGTIEDAQEIALAAKAVSKQQIFQAGLQLRSDPQRQFLLPFIRSGALGKFVMARAQWHKKTSWRATSPNPAREKAMNWRLYKATSTGLVGEVGCHQIDEIGWYLNGRPQAVTGYGSLLLWNQEKGDDRDVPDTVQAVIEYPGGVNLTYDATLANSFDGAYETIYGSDAAVMLRESKAWMFKEVDSPLLGWEVYATKETFFKETGIVLRAGASKSAQPTEQQTAEEQITSSPLFFALQNFLRNANDLSSTAEDYVTNYGADDKEGLLEALSKLTRRPAAGYLEGFQATVTGIKANEAVVSKTRLELKPEWYELG